MNPHVYADLATNKTYGAYINKFLVERGIKQTRINADVYFSQIENKLGVTKAQLQSTTRLRHVSDARYIFFFLLRRDSTLSLARIGSFVNRDHSTVLHGLGVVKNVNDKEFRKKINLFL